MRKIDPMRGSFPGMQAPACAPAGGARACGRAFGRFVKVYGENPLRLRPADYGRFGVDLAGKSLKLLIQGELRGPASSTSVQIPYFLTVCVFSQGFSISRNPRSPPSAAEYLYDRNILTRGIICDVIALILKEEGVWCHISGRIIFVLEKNS